MIMMIAQLSLPTYIGLDLGLVHFFSLTLIIVYSLIMDLLKRYSIDNPPLYIIL